GDVEPAQAIADLEIRLARGLVGVRRVLNGTGVLVHTNLGRSPLSAAALGAISVAAGTCDLELDLATGRRGTRGASLNDALLAEVTPAAGVHVVNNGAAALALVAMALGGCGEVIVSRGELIEIGAGFRLPDLVEATGVRLIEVGTTNRTHLADYRDAISEDTRLILKIHPSNYRVEGFTTGVGVEQLSSLGVPVVSDIGSGLLHPHPMLPDEPDATTHLNAGAAVVTSSGDKLLGGPQAGLILTADAGVAARVRKHPMARAYRIDKLTLAALEATVVGPQAPVLDMFETPVDELRLRASRVVATLDGIDARAVDTVSTVGGGGAPGSEFPSAGISLPSSYAAALRAAPLPVLARIDDNRCIVDLRAIDAADLHNVSESIRHAGAARV
ncbi:MAG: L-seryl-tRNA(Sec) selenium transferase, partial [Cumulibacter sp.]